jgi:hypothetical protein
MNPRIGLVALVLVAGLLSGCVHSPSHGFVPLFEKDGFPQGWTVRLWSDISEPGPTGTVWQVEGGVLQARGERGSWLIRDGEVGDFELEFEFLLGRNGNGGVALRAPLKGDPAFTGLELQLADARTVPRANETELTGAIYRSVPPRLLAYQPEQWNRCFIRLAGSRLRAEINGSLVQDLDLMDYRQPFQRPDGSLVPPLRDRPRRGHIGFQQLSRRDEPLSIRNARIRILN